MPSGKSRLGSTTSSAAVETASNPMYAKKITAAPFITPDHPIGANGLQFAGLTKNAPTTITAAITISLTPTMTELIRALSEMPMYST